MRRPRSAVTAIAAVAALILVIGWHRAEAATVTASYERGYAGVIINGYGTPAMGTFRLRDGGRTLLALCVESDVGHTRAADAYHPVEPRVRSAELDWLLWWLDRQPSIDNDTAVAAAALAWYYASSRRSIGPLVWSDGTRGFAPIGPLEPEPWDALARFSSSHPVGLVVPGSHLDAAERRVAELHRLAQHRAGPWSLSIELNSGRAVATLSGSRGAIPDAPVQFVVSGPGTPPATHTVRTDGHGRAAIDLPPAPDGATVAVSAAAPGPHREWDGSGVQRLATPTATTLTDEVRLQPRPRHVHVAKRSSDPTIAVGGATFRLRDANGATIGTATTDAAGSAAFAPIDPSRHRAPYELIETEAPPGLIAHPDPIVIDQASTDPDRPTIVTVDNHPATVPLAVRKRLSLEDAGPGELSGFVFEVRRRSDGWARELVTDAKGSAELAGLALGTYDVCETATPEWAANLVDTGCRTVVIDESTLNLAVVEVDYLNLVSEPRVVTSATDAADGDQVLGSDGGTIVDQVSLSGLVPGTTYVIRGELVTTGVPSRTTGLSGTTTLTAVGTEATVDVVIDVPASVAAKSSQLVIVEHVFVGKSLVASHDDLTDRAQTIDVVPPTTTTSTTTTTVASTTTTTPTTSTTTSIPVSTTAVPNTVPTTSTSSTTTTSTTVPPVTPTLPRTGSDQAVAAALRIGDVGFVLGVALVAVAGLASRRPGRDDAER